MSVNNSSTGDNTRGSHVSAPSRLPRKYTPGQSRQEPLQHPQACGRGSGIVVLGLTFAVSRKKKNPWRRIVVVGRTRGDLLPGGVENDDSHLTC